MMTVNSTNYDNVCQQLICFMLSSPITTKNENNRIQCKHSNLWFGTITNIPVNGSQFSKSLQNTNKLGHVFSTQNGYMLSGKLCKLFMMIWWKFFHGDIVFILWFQYITLYCIILVDGLNGGNTRLWCKESITIIVSDI
jgi:hypothetical protein